MKKNFLILLAILINFTSSVGYAEELPLPPATTPPPILVTIPVTCHTKDRHMLITASLGQLSLCDQGQVLKTYQVALGSGGLDKTVEGDRKTPLGYYTLGTPRPSDRFGVFIPIGYPTKIQKAMGLTGGSVGIHGPDRDFEFLGDLAVLINWTQGCIAVAYDLEINEIKNWVEVKTPKYIRIVK